MCVGKCHRGSAAPPRKWTGFQLQPLPYSGFATVPIFLAVGAVAGLLGVAYNRLILGALATAQRLGRWLPGDRRAATVGAAVGLLAWFGPRLVGGGDAITQRTLSGGESMTVVAGVFLVRFVLGPLSYATETPGGLFAPMLVLGAQGGLFLGIADNTFVMYSTDNGPHMNSWPDGAIDACRSDKNTSGARAIPRSGLHHSRSAAARIRQPRVPTTDRLLSPGTRIHAWR